MMTDPAALPFDLEAAKRKLKPAQRRILRELPKYKYQFWGCLRALGHGQATGHRWMRDANFAAVRRAVEQQALDEYGITTQRTMQEVAAVAFGDIRKLFTEDGRLKKMTEIDDETAASISGIDFEEINAGETTIGRVAKIRTRDKLKALELAGKFLKLWNEQEQKPTAPEGPGLTVIVHSNGAQAAVRAAPNAQGRVVVDLPGPG